jgi:hypothetical protein
VDAVALFPGELGPIPSNDGTGSVVYRSDLPHTALRHGAGYDLFAAFAGAAASAFASHPKALLDFLVLHAVDLQSDPQLARSADVFLGNCLNVAFDLVWIRSPELAIAGEDLSVTIEGTALVLALGPEHHELFLNQLSAGHSRRTAS